MPISGKMGYINAGKMGLSRFAQTWYLFNDQRKFQIILWIMVADKGSATVIMSKKNYIAEAERQLSNQKHYAKLDTPVYP